MLIILQTIDIISYRETNLVSVNVIDQTFL